MISVSFWIIFQSSIHFNLHDHENKVQNARKIYIYIYMYIFLAFYILFSWSWRLKCIDDQKIIKFWFAPHGRSAGGQAERLQGGVPGQPGPDDGAHHQPHLCEPFMKKIKNFIRCFAFPKLYSSKVFVFIVLAHYWLAE